MKRKKTDLRTLAGKLKLRESIKRFAEQNPVALGLSVIGGEVWLDKQDMLRLMHISERTLREWRRKKLMPFARIGGRIYYRELDLVSLLRKSMFGVSTISAILNYR
jgi:hypothetical protein